MRWAQFGCFTPLMQAHGRFAQEAWTYDAETLRIYRAVRPAARAARALRARRRGHRRPAAVCPSSGRCCCDPADERGWTLADQYGYGPALWVAPVLEEGAREREVSLPRGDGRLWTGERLSVAAASCWRRTA